MIKQVSAFRGGLFFIESSNALSAGKPLFSRQALSRLIIPLIIEQLLLMTVGMADTVMVTSAGEAAVSAVTLVDNINNLLIQVFAALSTGGAVVVSQYLGRKDRENARRASKQLLYAVTAAATVLMVFALLFRVRILSTIFGHIADDVMSASLDYFIYTTLAYPFIALYNAGAALFRSMGNSRVSMFNSFIVNLVNILVNAILIYGYGMGATGAAIGTLVSRVVGAGIILVLLQRRYNPLRIEGLLRPEFHGAMVKRILTIGIPTGLENSLFQVGKLIMLSLVTTLGATEALRTASIAANGIAGSVAGVVHMPGIAIGLAMVTVVGQCLGAREPEQAAYYVKRLLRLAYLMVGVLSVILFFTAEGIVGIFHLGPEATALAARVLRILAAFSVFFWPSSFALPNALRAAGDAVFTMTVSLLSMFTFRLALSYVLAPMFLFGLPMPGMGLVGVWIAMCLDWIVRSAFFLTRFLRGKWKNIKVI